MGMDFVNRAKRAIAYAKPPRVELQRQKGSIFCYAEGQKEGSPFPGRVFSEGDKDPPDRFAPSALWTVQLRHSRDRHVEVQALRALESWLGTKGKAQHLCGDGTPRALVRLYVTEFPCLSCVGALCQF